MKNVSRRQFLFYVLGAAGAVALSRVAFNKTALASPKEGMTGISTPGAFKPTTGNSLKNNHADGQDTAPLENFQPGIVIDVGACIGCRTCMYVCKAENNIPESISPPWPQVFQMPDSVDLTGHPSQEELIKGSTTNYTSAPQPGFWYLGTQCNHCKNAPCVKVCPTGATHKDKDGYVLMDYHKCIGCRFCIVACPYNARRFNWVKPQLNEKDINPLVPVRPIGVVEKCTFCVHRTREGKLPRCVEACPVGARHFGNLLDPNSEASKVLKAERSIRLLEELNTEPHISYITRGKKYTR